MKKGMSLLEILVAVTIFAILGVVITRSVILTLRGSKKSEDVVKVRENISYAFSVIERQLRNADSIIECPNITTPSVLDYKDQLGAASTFSCVGIGSADSYIASGSARLTSSGVVLESCDISCVSGASNEPPFVTVSVTTSDPQISQGTKIYLRNY